MIIAPVNLKIPSPSVFCRLYTFMDPIQTLSSALVGVILAGQQQSTSAPPPSGQAAAAASATATNSPSKSSGCSSKSKKRWTISYDKDIICLPQKYGRIEDIPYPRGKFRTKLGRKGLVGKVYIT